MCCSRGRATTTIDRSRRRRRSAVVAGSTALVLLTAMGTPALAAPGEPGGGPPSAAPVVHGDAVTLTGEGVVQYSSERYGELPRAACTTGPAAGRWCRCPSRPMPQRSPFGYSYARATVNASVKNDIAGRVLCGILWGSTYASHSPTVVRGYRDGTAQYSTDTSKSGNCSWLLRTNQTNTYSYL